MLNIESQLSNKFQEAKLASHSINTLRKRPETNSFQRSHDQPPPCSHWSLLLLLPSAYLNLISRLCSLRELNQLPRVQTTSALNLIPCTTYSWLEPRLTPQASPP